MPAGRVCVVALGLALLVSVKMLFALSVILPFYPYPGPLIPHRFRPTLPLSEPRTPSFPSTLWAPFALRSQTPLSATLEILHISSPPALQPSHTCSKSLPLNFCPHTLVRLPIVAFAVFTSTLSPHPLNFTSHIQLFYASCLVPLPSVLYS